MSPRRPRRALRPLALDGIHTYPLAERKSQVALEAFGRPHRRGASAAELLDSLPKILGGVTLRAVAGDIARARALEKPILWGIGAHVLKVGLSGLLIDLMRRGYVTGLAMNGAGIVHDFELAVAGQTSEDVAAGLGEGAFGMARETGEELNRAIVLGDKDGLGIGAAVGPPPGRAARAAPAGQPAGDGVAARAARHGHVAIGTDIVHMHPACDPGAVGRASHLDFRMLAAHVARLGGGGVYLNVGSAVLLPEVFLKCVTLARNLGQRLSDFTTVNLDFIQSYRPNTNVVSRPTRGVGRGYSVTGHHEILIPLLAAALIEGVWRGPRPAASRARARRRRPKGA
jgi:hypothetical protein